MKSRRRSPGLGDQREPGGSEAGNFPRLWEPRKAAGTSGRSRRLLGSPESGEKPRGEEHLHSAQAVFPEGTLSLSHDRPGANTVSCEPVRLQADPRPAGAAGPRGRFRKQALVDTRPPVATLERGLFATHSRWFQSLKPDLSSGIIFFPKNRPAKLRSEARHRSDVIKFRLETLGGPVRDAWGTFSLNSSIQTDPGCGH